MQQLIFNVTAFVVGLFIGWVWFRFEIERLAKKLSSLKNNNAGQFDDLETRFPALHKEAMRLSVELVSLQSQLRTKDEGITELQKQVGDLMTEAVERDSIISAYVEQFAALKKVSDENECTIVGLRQERQTLERALENTAARLLSANTELVKLNGELQEMCGIAAESDKLMAGLPDDPLYQKQLLSSVTMVLLAINQRVNDPYETASPSDILIWIRQYMYDARKRLNF